MPVKIGYLLNTYPRPSHSFIRREIAAHEAAGVDLHRFAMRDVRAELVDPADIDEAARTEYVLRPGAPARLAWAALGALARQPAQTLSALRLARRMARTAGGGLGRHLVYWAEACHVAARCRVLGIEHLHAHFGTNPAAVALLVHALGGPGYSFTVHGPEEFDAPQALSLGLKLGRARFAVAISSYGRSQLMRWADPDDWPRLHVVHCGIEPARFAAPSRLPGGAPKLVAIGRLVEQKGQLLLIEALAEAARQHPDIHLTLVGNGPLRPAIEAAIHRHGLREQVTITGWVDEARVRVELAAAQALIMPSFAEGLPMVVMEAMAAGRPVIATWVAGTPELVRAGETGWLVPAGDREALAEAIDDFARTPHEALAAMGKAGRARALARHDVSHEAQKLAAHFRAAIAANEKH